MTQKVSDLLVSAIAILIIFGFSEIALRLYSHWSLSYDIEMSRYATEIKDESSNPLIGHIHKPNSQATLMGVPVEINSDGLRDHEYPIERTGSYRIIFLGDSLTFGWGVEKSKTFEEILEADLNSKRPTEIINFGTGNYNTVQEASQFAEKGLKYKPDQVVVFYFINDAEPTPHRSNWTFLSRSRMVTFFWSRINSVLTRFGANKSFQQYYADLYTEDQVGWIAAKKAFLDLRNICATKNIMLQVILLPELHVLDHYPFAAEHRKVFAFLRDNSIEALDLAPFFEQEKSPMRLWVAPDDAHPNDIAHAMIAKYSLNFIMKGVNGQTTAGGH